MPRYLESSHCSDQGNGPHTAVGCSKARCSRSVSPPRRRRADAAVSAGSAAHQSCAPAASLLLGPTPDTTFPMESANCKLVVLGRRSHPISTCLVKRRSEPDI